MKKLPRDKANDYTRDMAAARRAVVTEETAADPAHTGSFSIDPALRLGNIEAFAGVVQVPMGFAGPLLADGTRQRRYPWPSPSPRINGDPAMTSWGAIAPDPFRPSPL